MASERNKIDDTCWLAATYHLPATYSCRLPFSSATNALISPAPGPATVRLACIRAGVELMGREQVRKHLFPSICTMSVLIRPPERVALTTQLLQGYKVGQKQKVNISLLSREMAHADGELTIYLRIPTSDQDMWETVLTTIGYWGQTNSFASCIGVEQQEPDIRECVTLLDQAPEIPLQQFFACILTEFRDPTITWKEIDPFTSSRRTQPFKMDMYIWPLRFLKHHGSGKLLVRTPLSL